MTSAEFPVESQTPAQSSSDHDLGLRGAKRVSRFVASPEEFRFPAPANPRASGSASDRQHPLSAHIQLAVPP